MLFNWKWLNIIQSCLWNNASWRILTDLSGWLKSQFLSQGFLNMSLSMWVWQSHQNSLSLASFLHLCENVCKILNIKAEFEYMLWHVNTICLTLWSQQQGSHTPLNQFSKTHVRIAILCSFHTWSAIHKQSDSLKNAISLLQMVSKNGGSWLRGKGVDYNWVCTILDLPSLCLVFLHHSAFISNDWCNVIYLTAHQHQRWCKRSDLVI